MRDKAMNTQDNNAVTVSFVDSFQSYAADSKRLGELKTRLEDTRKILEPVIRAHKIPIAPKAENNKAWKEKREIFYPLVKELEWPAIDEDVVQDELFKKHKRQAEARIVAWLGVIRTCLEYQILPTDKNADRLRKAKVWVGLNGNGKINPNRVDPAPTTAPTTTAPATTAPTVTAPTANQTQTTTKAPSVSATTPQKAEDKVHPLTSNVSSTDAPLSAREHFKVLFNQLTKNETFREEYCGILALMLDVEKSTLTRCMVQAADEVKV